MVSNSDYVQRQTNHGIVVLIIIGYFGQLVQGPHRCSADKDKTQWSDKSVDANLEYLHGILPKGNTCPKKCHEAKKVVCPFDLPHERYHVCINDCYIFRKEDEEKINVKCARSLDTRKGRKPLTKLCGTFRSFLVCSDISQTVRKQSECASTWKEGWQC